MSMKNYSVRSWINKFDELEIKDQHIIFNHSGFGKRRIKISDIDSVELRPFILLNHKTKVFSAVITSLLALVWVFGTSTTEYFSQNLFPFEILLLFFGGWLVLEIFMYYILGEIVITTSSTLTRLRGQRHEIEVIYDDIKRLEHKESDIDDEDKDDEDEESVDEA